MQKAYAQINAKYLCQFAHAFCVGLLYISISAGFKKRRAHPVTIFL